MVSLLEKFVAKSVEAQKAVEVAEFQALHLSRAAMAAASVEDLLSVWQDRVIDLVELLCDFSAVSESLIAAGWKTRKFGSRGADSVIRGIAPIVPAVLPDLCLELDEMLQQWGVTLVSGASSVFPTDEALISVTNEKLVDRLDEIGAMLARREGKNPVTGARTLEFAPRMFRPWRSKAADNFRK